MLFKFILQLIKRGFRYLALYVKLYEIICATAIYFIMDAIILRILHNCITPIFALAKTRLFVRVHKKASERLYKFGKLELLHFISPYRYFFAVLRATFKAPAALERFCPYLS